MNEVRQFLRYVTPGLLFVVETVGLLWRIRPTWVEQNVFLARDVDFGTAATALLAAGGIGFFLSVVHHQWQWWWRQSAPDYSGLIKRLRQVPLPLLELRREDAKRNNDPVGRAEAWLLVSVLWEERIGSSERWKAAYARGNSYSDLFHSIGAARAGTLCAPLVAGMIAAHVSKDLPNVAHFIGAAVVAVGIWLVFHRTYQRTGRMTQRFVAEIVMDNLAETKSGPLADVKSTRQPDAEIKSTPPQPDAEAKSTPRQPDDAKSSPGPFVTHPDF